MSPIIVDKEEKQQHIARAALDIFSKQGYANASMSKIGEAAGVGKSTLYEYFQNKADIFICAIDAWVEQIGRKLSALMADRDDPVDKLFVLAELASDIGSARNPAMNRMYIEMCEQMHIENGVLYHRWDLIENTSVGIRRILTDVILDGISTRMFKAEIARDAERIAINILACVDGLLFNNLIGNQHFDLNWQIKFYLTNLIATIKTPQKSRPRAAH